MNKSKIKSITNQRNFYSYGSNFCAIRNYYGRLITTSTDIELYNKLYYIPKYFRYIFVVFNKGHEKAK